MLYDPLHEPESPVAGLQSADSAVTTLSEVLDPIALAKHLRLVSLPLNSGAVEEVRVHALRRKRRRCTLEISLRTESGWRSVIGKVYDHDRADVFQTMDQIRQAGFGPGEEFSIPQPLAYVSSLRLLLQEKVEGPRATEVFRAGDERSSAAAAERCGKWLARFHAMAPKAGPVFDSERCLSLMRRRARRIYELGGRIADKAAGLLQLLEDAVSALCPVEMSASHGSYQATQVILAEGRTVVFDWDRYQVADPACDVGRFLAALRHSGFSHFGSLSALDATAELFLSAYLSAGRPEVKNNLPFYRAAACLKIASQSGSGWQEKTEAKLDEGLRILEGKGALY